MFPLNLVLFPGQILPLHIFEDRYRMMVEEIIDKEREFGVVLIERGSEVGGGDTGDRIWISDVLNRRLGLHLKTRTTPKIKHLLKPRNFH